MHLSPVCTLNSDTIVIISTMLNFVKFGVLPFVEIDHVMQECLSLAGTYQSIVRVVGNFHSKFSVVQ